MKVFIINLLRSPERKEQMSARLESLRNEPLFNALNLEPQFFPATDSKSDEFATYKAKFDSKACYLLHGRILLDNEIACYASHYRLWEECVRLQEAIIVLEDDIYFEPHFLQGIQEIRDSGLPFVRLYFIDHKRDKFARQIGDTPFYYSLKNLNGTQGYYLTPQAAAAFLSMSVWDSPVDIAMEFVSRHKVDNIIYKPFLIGEDSTASNSTIATNGKRISDETNQVPLSYRIVKPFYRAFIQAQRALFKLSYTPPRIPKS